MKEILSAIEEWLKNLNDYHSSYHQENGGRACETLIRVVSEVKELIQKNSFSLILDIISARRNTTDNSRNAIDKITKDATEFMLKLHLACDTYYGNNTHTQDSIVKFLLVLSSGLVSIHEKVKKENSLILKSFKSQIIEHLTSYLYHFKALCFIRQHNLQELESLSFIKEHEILGDYCRETDDKELARINGIIANRFNGRLQKIASSKFTNVVFEFYTQVPTQLKFLDFAYVIVYAKTICQFLELHKETEIKKNIEASLAKIESNFLQKQSAIVQKLEKYSHWPDDCLKSLNVVNNNLEYGIDIHCKSYFKSIESILVTTTLCKLKEKVTDIIGITKALRNISFLELNEVNYQGFIREYFEQEIDTLRNMLVHSANLVFSKKHPSKEIFIQTFATECKSENELEITTYINKNIQKIFMIPGEVVKETNFEITLK